MYRIYINQAVLIIADSSAQGPEEGCQKLQLEELNFRQFVHDLLRENRPAKYIIEDGQADLVLKKLAVSVQTIQAAGGLVKNEKGEHLFIFRRGKWDLPKGKVDDGENVEQAAKREVEEECGIKVSQAGPLLGITYHMYELHGDLILKPTTWYSMKVVGQHVLVPQIEEDITEVRWLPTSGLELVLQNTYPLVREVIINWVAH